MVSSIPNFIISVDLLSCSNSDEIRKDLNVNVVSSISGSGWFQLYTTSSKQTVDRDTSEQEDEDSMIIKSTSMADHIVETIQEQFPSISSPITLRVTAESTILKSLNIKLKRYIKGASEIFNSDFLSLDKHEYLKSHYLLSIPLLNVIICCFDHTSSSLTNSILNPLSKWCENNFNCEVSESLVIGFSSSKYQEIEKHSKKLFEKCKSEIGRLLGSKFKEYFIWYNNYEAGNVVSTSFQSKIIELISSCINSRLKIIIDAIKKLRDEGPKPANLNHTKGIITPDFTTPKVTPRRLSPSVGEVSPNQDSPNTCNTQCRKLQLSDVWYQWILEMINLNDLYAIFLVQCGLFKEALLIYKTLLPNTRHPEFLENDPLIQTCILAPVTNSNIPLLLLPSDCCLGDCKTHSLDEASLLPRDSLVLPLKLKDPDYNPKRRTYFEILMLSFSRQMYILNLLNDVKEIYKLTISMSKRFVVDILSRIQDIDLQLGCYLWLFRFTFYIGMEIYTGNKDNNHNLLNSHLDKLPSPISLAKTVIITSLLPKLIHTLGASGSMDVWQHKPSTPKLPPDTNVSSMEVQTALAQWGIHCFSSILLNTLFNKEELYKMEQVTYGNSLTPLENIFWPFIEGASLFHSAAKYFALLCQIYWNNIWKYYKTNPIWQSYMLLDINNTHDDVDTLYKLSDLCKSLDCPSKAFKILCEIVGIAGMDYISHGQVRSVVSLPWGIFFESEAFLEWIVAIKDETNNICDIKLVHEKRLNENKEYMGCDLDYNEHLVSHNFCYKIVRLWLDFSIILVPIPFQWSLLTDIAHNMYTTFLAKKVTPVVLSYINSTDSYLLQAEIGIRLFLMQINGNVTESDKVIEAYINKCLEESELENEESLHWEFPAPPNIWTYFANEFVSTNSKAQNATLSGVLKIPFINKEPLEIPKSNKGNTLRVAEKQILMALLGGGRIIRLPRKALPCCGLLDPWKPVQGYFYVFHEILRPSGRLLLRSPSILSPLQSPLGSHTIKSPMKVKVDEHSNINMSQQKTEGIEQVETSEAVSNKTYTEDQALGRNNSKGSWFNRKVSWTESGSTNSTNNNSLNNRSTSPKKKDGSPRQWVWDLVTGLKWGATNSTSSNTSNKYDSSNSIESQRFLSQTQYSAQCKKDTDNRNSGKLEKVSLSPEIRHPNSKPDENSPAKVITVPTPGPTNWVITEGTNSCSRRTVALSPNITSPGDSRTLPTTSPNTWIKRVIIPNVPLKFILYIYLGSSNPLTFSSIWFRLQTGQWLPLEQLSSTFQLNPGVNHIQVDLICHDLAPFEFAIDSIGLSIQHIKSNLPINFLWVIPLGTLPSPHIMPKIVYEFMKSERSKGIEFRSWSLSRGEFKNKYQDPWYPLNRWTTLCLFNVLSLKDVFDLKISSENNDLYVDSIKSLDCSLSLPTLISNTLSVTGNIKKKYKFSIKIDKDWLESSVSNFVIELDFSACDPNIQIYTHEATIISLDKRLTFEDKAKIFQVEEGVYILASTLDYQFGNSTNLPKSQDITTKEDIPVHHLGSEDILKNTLENISNSSLKQRQPKNVVILPKFSHECILEIPIKFSLSLANKPTPFELIINLNGRISKYNVESSNLHRFSFYVQPQVTLDDNFQPAIDNLEIDSHSYYELSLISSDDGIYIERLITSFPNNKNLEDISLSYKLITSVSLLTKSCNYPFIPSNKISFEHTLSSSLFMKSRNNRVKFIWLSTENLWKSKIHPYIYILSRYKEDMSEYSISGPFEITIFFQNSIYPKISDTYITNSQLFTLASVNFKPHGKINKSSTLHISLNYCGNTSDTFNYYISQVNPTDKYPKWWFLGPKSDTVIVQPNIQVNIKFEIVPLVSGLLDLPIFCIGKKDSDLATYKTFTFGQQIVL
ncbi:hypothetical protein cand_034360 [Cryptosporidium andersoni]|uniref:Uncharacterized protein n=1 Tax=Cryptosporidium andersoni TaxID=117008 RepID=A0A1J4MVS9_9CRYT|nr:hypothetical protein cand_034360 [Cryptosporidium andersoni]